MLIVCSGEGGVRGEYCKCLIFKQQEVGKFFRLFQSSMALPVPQMKALGLLRS